MTDAAPDDVTLEESGRSERGISAGSMAAMKSQLKLMKSLHQASTFDLGSVRRRQPRDAARHRRRRRPPALLSLPKEAVVEESSSESAPPSPLKREETGLAVREMLKESYREFTGHALPDYMTNEQAKVELNKFIFQWDDVDDDEEEGEDGEKSPAHNMSLSTILVASKFARKLGKQTKARRAGCGNEVEPRRARAAQGVVPRDHGLGDAQLDDADAGIPHTPSGAAL